MIRPGDVATRGYLQGNTLGIAVRGYLRIDIPEEVAERGGGSPSRGKGDKFDILRDEEELLIVMEYIVKFSLI